MQTKKPTLVQVETRRASMEKLLDGPGGAEAMTQLLTERLDSELLFDVLRAQDVRGNDLCDTYDAIKTWCQLDNDGDPWRLVRASEVIDEEKHIDATDRSAVVDAARALDLLVYTDTQDMKESFDGVMIDADEEYPFTKLLEHREVDDEVYKYVADTNNDPNDPLVVWLEIYGWELRRRGSRVA